MTGVGSDGVLLTGIEHDLVEDGVAGVFLNRMAVVVGRGLTLNVQINLTVTATEGLLLTDVVLLGQGRMDVLRAGHAGQQNHLLAAVTVGVDVGHQKKTGVVDVVQTEVCDLDVSQLVRIHDDACLCKYFRCLLASDLDISFFHDVASFHLVEYVRNRARVPFPYIIHDVAPFVNSFFDFSQKNDGREGGFPNQQKNF